MPGVGALVTATDGAARLAMWDPFANMARAAGQTVTIVRGHAATGGENPMRVDAPRSHERSGPAIANWAATVRAVVVWRSQGLRTGRLLARARD